MDNENLSENEIRYENMYLSILQNEQRIEPFLDSVFKFLYRRTDFFLIQENPQQSYGFPIGVAKNIVTKLFEKYDNLSKDQIKRKLESVESTKTLKTSIKTTESANTSKSAENTNKNTNLKPSNETKLTSDNNNATNENLKDSQDLKKKQEYFQSLSESYNGAVREKYSWSQSIKDIDIKIKVNNNILKSKDVKVKLEKQFIYVQTKSIDQQNWSTIIEDKFQWKIKPEESTWSLFPADHIHINVEKVEERWWEKLLENEEKLDMKNINPEKPITDLEQEAQVKIQQLMYDQHRKQLGLPTSEEEKYQEMLQKAWNAEGSPFAGTDYDPSKISIKDGNITIK